MVQYGHTHEARPEQSARGGADRPPRIHPSPNGTANETTHHTGNNAFITTMSRSACMSATLVAGDVVPP